MNYSKGICWIDDCRIPFVDETILLKGYTGDKWKSGELKEGRVKDRINTNGRYPANLLCSDDVLNDGSISKSVKGGKGKAILNNKSNKNMVRTDTIVERGGFNDKGSNSRYYDIDAWFNNLINNI